MLNVVQAIRQSYEFYDFHKTDKLPRNLPETSQSAYSNKMGISQKQKTIGN